MMNLIQAFKFCQIKDEMVYLTNIKSNNSHGFWSEKIRKKLDMKKIKVYKQGFEWNYDGTFDIKFYVNTPEKDLYTWEYEMERL